MLPNEDILRGVVGGSHEAFRSLFMCYYPKVRAFIHGFLKNDDDAEDVAQLVFIKLWNKREQFRNVHHFDAYLYALTKYTMLNFIAAKRPVVFTEEVEKLETACETTPDIELETRDLELRIDMIVESMPLQRRTVFRLSRIQGLANDEIARRLGIQKKTVENHLNLALKELKEALQVYLIMLIIWVNNGY